MGAAGAQPVVDPGGEPKSLLNTRVQLSIARSVVSGDIAYETMWKPEIRGFHCVLKVNALDQVFEAEVPHESDKKQSEKAAARVALEANRELFEHCCAAHEAKKMHVKGNSKGKFGKGKGYNSFQGP